MATIPLEQLFNKQQIVWTIFADDEHDIRTTYGGFLSDLVKSEKPVLQDPRRYMVRIVDGKTAAEEQYEALTKEGHKVGLVLTDRNMEYDNAGFDLLKKIRGKNKHTRRAMLTAYPEYSLLRDGTIHSFLVKATGSGDKMEELSAVVLAELRNFFDTEELMAMARYHYDQARAVGLANDALQVGLERAEENRKKVEHEQGQRALGIRYLMSEFGKGTFNKRMEEYFHQLLGEDMFISVEGEVISNKGFQTTPTGILYHGQLLPMAEFGEGQINKEIYASVQTYKVNDQERRVTVVVHSKKRKEYTLAVLGDFVTVFMKHLQISEDSASGWESEDNLSESIDADSSAEEMSGFFSRSLAYGELEQAIEIIDSLTMTNDELVRLVTEMFPYAQQDTNQVMVDHERPYQVDKEKVTPLLGMYQAFFADVAEAEVQVTMKDLPHQLEIVFSVPYRGNIWEDNEQAKKIQDLHQQTGKVGCGLYVTNYLELGVLESPLRTALGQFGQRDVLAYYQRIPDQGYLGEPTKITESMYQQGRIDVSKALALQLEKNPAIKAIFDGKEISTLDDLLKTNAALPSPVFKTSGEYTLIVYK